MKKSNRTSIWMVSGLADRTQIVTASVMGRWVSSPRMDHVAGFMLPSVVGPRPPTMRSERNPRADLNELNPRPRGRAHQQLPGFIGFRVPATGTSGGGAARPGRNRLMFLLRGGLLLAEAEVGAVHPHPMRTPPPSAAL